MNCGLGADLHTIEPIGYFYDQRNSSPALADLWRQVMGEPWQPSLGSTGSVARQRLRDEIDAQVAHLYGLSRDEFAHILDAFPLIFPDNAAGQQKKAALLAVYERIGV